MYNPMNFLKSVTDLKSVISGRKSCDETDTIATEDANVSDLQTENTQVETRNSKKVK